MTSETKVDRDGKQTKVMKYNERDELIESTFTNKKGSIKTKYAYDVEGNKTVAKNGKIEERYKYNKRGQLESVKSNKGTKTYTYDKNGHVRRIKQNDGLVDKMTYNDFGMMTSLNNQNLESAYKYDANNNRIQTKTVDIAKYNDAKSKEEMAGQFDVVAQRIALMDESFNCNVALNGSIDYSGVGYVQVPRGDASNLDYGTETIDYLSDGDVSVAKVLHEDSSIAKNDKVYTYGADVIKANNEYYLTKINGTISKITNNKGQVKKSLEYSDYGQELSGYSGGKAYNGEMVDATGLQYLRARYLDMNMGMFIQKDTYLGEQDDILSQNQS